MSIPIRVLVVEDSEDDTLLLIDELIASGYDPTYLRVDTSEAMQDALAHGPWDIVIADYKMPKFSGPNALRVLQESGSDVPFILVSGTAGNHVGVDMMRAGAQDFITKDSLSRLVPAITRELAEANTRAQRSKAEDKARASAENYRTMFTYAPVPTVTYDRDAVVLQVNPAFEQLFGFTAQEVVGKHIWETFGLPENAERTREVARRVFTGEAVRNAEYEDVSKSGKRIYVLANVTPVYDEQDKITMALSMITDITERKLREQSEKALEAHKRDFYRRTILAFTGGKLVIAEPEDIDAITKNQVGSWTINSLEDLAQMRSASKELLLSLGMDDHRVYDFIGAIVEAATNALKHASGGEAALYVDQDDAVFTIRDHGPGIEALSLPDVALTKGYSTAQTLGMGYKVMIEFADRIYLSTSPEGTIVAIEMKLKQKTPTAEESLQTIPGW